MFFANKTEFIEHINTEVIKSARIGEKFFDDYYGAKELNHSWKKIKVSLERGVTHEGHFTYLQEQRLVPYMTFDKFKKIVEGN